MFFVLYIKIRNIKYCTPGVYKKKSCTPILDFFAVHSNRLCTISTCPNFGKTKDCTMPKLLYFGQGSLKQIWSPCGWRFFLENHGQCTEAEALVQSAVFSKLGQYVCTQPCPDVLHKNQASLYMIFFST